MKEHQAGIACLFGVRAQDPQFSLSPSRAGVVVPKAVMVQTILAAGRGVGLANGRDRTGRLAAAQRPHTATHWGTDAGVGRA